MRLKTLVTRFKEEDGQAIVLLALAMGIFLLGAIGLAVDGSILYTQRQMAQAAADAAAQAGIMSIFDGTNGTGTAAFSTSKTIICTTTDAETPCVYARKNGFGGSADDKVTVSFPDDSTVPGVKFSPLATDPTNLIKVEVKRDVNTTLLRLLGSTVTTMRATAMAAIVDVNAPVPILITHPTLTQSLFLQGNPAIKICGGPARSIQVNSSDPNAFHNQGSATVDLSKAGPKDDGKCNTGTGADFGTWGGPALALEPKGVTTGVGKYIQPSSPVQDPLKDVKPPDPKSFPTPPATIPPLGDGANGCPSPSKKACHLYSPGIYPGGINGDNTTPVFKPGIYYIQGGGITCHNNCEMYMATGFTDGASGTNTGWTGNVLFYNTGSTGSPTNSGSIVIDANGTTNLVGSCSGSDPLCVGDASYKGILFFEDRAADAQTHAMGGGGAMTLTGTIYMTNTLATMTATSAHYQGLTLNGGSGSGTLIQGEIIVGTLTMQGNGGITMDLDPNASLVVRQVALVN